MDPDDRWEFGIFVAVASVRLLWRARASVARGNGLAWLGFPLAVVVAGGMLAPTYEQPEPKLSGPQDLPTNRGLATTLSLRQNLSGADLRRRDLSRIYLYGKDLSYANLSEAKLEGANLRHARLRRVNLKRADLDFAFLSRADLRGAQLSRAQLYFTRLDHADLRRAQPKGVDFDFVILCGTDLRGARLDRDVQGRPYSDARTRWPAGTAPPTPNVDRLYEC